MKYLCQYERKPVAYLPPRLLLGLLVAVKKITAAVRWRLLLENTFNFAGGRGGEREVVVDVLKKPSQFFEIGNGHY